MARRSYNPAYLSGELTADRAGHEAVDAGWSVKHLHAGCLLRLRGVSVRCTGKRAGRGRHSTWPWRAQGCGGQVRIARIAPSADGTLITMDLPVLPGVQPGVVGEGMPGTKVSTTVMACSTAFCTLIVWSRLHSS